MSTQKPCTMPFFAAGFHNLAIRELLFLFLSWMLFVYCIVYYCIFLYMHTCIVVVVFGILMEFDLYATVIAGTTANKHQHNIFLFVRMCHDDGDHYVFFILCPWTPILFFVCDKGLHPAELSTLLLPTVLCCCWRSEGFPDQIDNERKSKTMRLLEQYEQRWFQSHQHNYCYTIQNTAVFTQASKTYARMHTGLRYVQYGILKAPKSPLRPVSDN
jgi:hypothetical protein